MPFKKKAVQFYFSGVLRKEFSSVHAQSAIIEVVFTKENIIKEGCIASSIE